MKVLAATLRAFGMSLLAWGGFGLASTQAQNPTDVVRLIQNPAIQSALATVRRSEPQTVEDGARFCEVPAPPFMEGQRAEVLKSEFVQLGLRNVRIDRAGNVLGDLDGKSPNPRLVVAAHLDTVFPGGTLVEVKREGPVFRGPGIGDNCRGLAVLAALARVLVQSEVQLSGSITFVADVGEEGLGDLRGMKALFGETMKGQVDRFVAIDGPGLMVVTEAVGSHRYRITFKGPGGHSYGAFGVASPIAALGRAVAKIYEIRVVQNPRTTFNVGRIGGGTSVNAIAEEAWMEVDLRSESPTALAALEVQVQRAVDAGVAEENQRWATPGAITVVKELVGDRPAGSVARDSPIVQTALAVGRALNLKVELSSGSTDANLAMSLKIPAIAIGGGGRGSGAHTLAESFDSTNSWQGTQNALLLAIALSE